MAASISSIVGSNNTNSMLHPINLPIINTSPTILRLLIENTYSDLNGRIAFEDQKIYFDCRSTMRKHIANAQATNFFSSEAKLERFKLLFLLSRVHALKFQKKRTIESSRARLQSLIISNKTNQKIKEEIKIFFAKDGRELGKELLMQNMTEEHSVSTSHTYHPLNIRAFDRDSHFVSLIDGKANFLLFNQYRTTIEHQVKYLENKVEAIWGMKIYPTPSIQNPDDCLLETRIDLGKEFEGSIHQFTYQYDSKEKRLLIEAIVERTFTSEILLDFGIEPELEHLSVCYKTKDGTRDTIKIVAIAHFNLFMKRGFHLRDINGKTLFHHLLSIKAEFWNEPATLLLNHFLNWFPNPFIKDLNNHTPKEFFEAILKKHSSSGFSKGSTHILSLLENYKLTYMLKCKSELNYSLPAYPTVLISIIQDYLEL